MKKIILTLSIVFSIAFSACGHSCPSILGEWQSSRELSYEYAKSAEGITENQLEFISQAFGHLKFTYYPKYALQHETPEFPIVINGKNHPMSFEEKHQKVKYLKCTKELVVVRFITDEKEIEIMELHFVNENTFWVSSGSKIREYFIRNKEHA